MGLSNEFMYDLKFGKLSPFIKLLKDDKTLSMEIKNDNNEYISIYYRGGNLLKLTKGVKLYNAYFDMGYFNYLELEIPSELPGKIDNIDHSKKWIKAVPIIKHAMDMRFGKEPMNEREFQQVMIRENNFCSAAGDTDYYICDMEYNSKQGEFDLVAVHWLSTRTDKKNNRNLGLAIIEMKYMDKNLKGNSGIQKHLNDIEKFLEDPSTVNAFKEEMRIKYNQKLELGLIINNNKRPIESFNDEKPEVILVLANHKPALSDLKTVLDEIKSKISNDDKYSNFTLKIAVSNFFGYGLYRKSIYTLEDFMDKFEEQIYS